MSRPEFAKFRNLLIDSSEKILQILGNSVAENFITTGTLGDGFSILTDERVYFKGNCLIRSGKRFYRKLEERVVDLKDITGTGFIHNRNELVHLINKFSKYIAIGIDVLAIFDIFAGNLEAISFLMVPWLFVILFLILDNALNYSVFEIAFAGGGIAFDLRWVSESEAERFQKALRQAKDDKKKQQTTPAVTTPPVNPDNNMDDLLKLKELLDKGIITQEEFDAKKKQLLNI